MDLENDGMNNLAILNIDGSYTNNQKFKELPDEGQILCELNNLKNKMITKYDYAYKEFVPMDEDDTETFIKEVRQTFFKLIKPFLVNVP